MCACLNIISEHFCIPVIKSPSILAVRVMLGEESDDDSVGADHIPGLIVDGQLSVLDAYFSFGLQFLVADCNISVHCGVGLVVMFCFVFFLKFRLPIGLHISCNISPTAGGTCKKMIYKTS